MTVTLVSGLDQDEGARQLASSPTVTKVMHVVCPAGRPSAGQPYRCRACLNCVRVQDGEPHIRRAWREAYKQARNSSSS